MSDRLHFGPFQLDAANATLTRDGARVELAPKAFDLLVELARRPGQLVTKDEILDTVWGRRFVSESALKTVVSSLRAALVDDARTPRWVETVSRRGYRFIGLAETPTGQAAEPIEPVEPTVASPAAPSEPVASHVIGRREALAALQRSWADAARGGARLVFVAGEPGMGKTTLLSEFARRLDGGVRAFGQCVEHYGSGEPYLPVLEALNALCIDDPQHLPVVRQVAPTWLVQMPWHLGESDRAALQREVTGASQDRMLREMGMLLERLAAHMPLLLVLEDLHWSDPSTVQLIDHLARRRGAARLLVLASFRPADVIANNHPMGNLRRELRLHRLCEEIHLEGFSRSQIAEFVAARLPGAEADAGFIDALERHTDGLPLFLASVLDELGEQGLLRRDATGRWQRPGGDTLRLPLPDNLLGLAERQILRLPVEQRQLLEAAALCAAEFDHLSLAQAIDADAALVRERLDGLVRRKLWLRACEPRTLPDGRVAMRYAFGHALFRHAFEHRLGAVARMELHRRFGIALEAQHGARAGEIAGELARHAEAGEDPARAARWYAVAAQSAMQRLAPHEALVLADRGLAGLRPLADGPDRAAELPLLSLRIGALAVTRGYSTQDAAPSIERALALIDALPLSDATLPLWHAIWWALNNGGAWERAGALGERLDGLAAQSGNPVARAVAANLRGMTVLFSDRFVAGIAHLRESLAWQDEAGAAAMRLPFVQDLRIESLANLVVALQACARFDEAEAVRVQIEARIAAGTDPLSEVMGLWYMACAAQLRRDLPAMQALGERGVALMSTRSALPGAGPHRVSLGWARVMAGERDDALADVDRGVAHYQRQGSVMGMAWFRASQAEAHLACGRLTSAREHIDAALVLAESGLCFLRGDLHRVDAALRWAAGESLDDAVARWERAIALARESAAPLLELLAVLDCAAALAASGRGAAALARLDDVLTRIAEDAACPALRQARALRDRLAASGL